PWWWSPRNSPKRRSRRPRTQTSTGDDRRARPRARNDSGQAGCLSAVHFATPMPVRRAPSTWHMGCTACPYSAPRKRPAARAERVSEAPSPRPPPRFGEGVGGRGPRTHPERTKPANGRRLSTERPLDVILGVPLPGVVEDLLGVAVLDEVAGPAALRGVHVQ